RVLDEIPDAIATKVQVCDFDSYFRSVSSNDKFDRVVMFDVLEHFSAHEATKLFIDIKEILKESGRIVVRVPNMTSPFALGIQYNDVTHRTAFTPGSLRQVASAAGLILESVRGQAYSTFIREV